MSDYSLALGFSACLRYQAYRRKIMAFSTYRTEGSADDNARVNGGRTKRGREGRREMPRASIDNQGI
ncbi:hypothetical protein L1987_08417 [Smallanthus sonchifolius]|uniref:Uncharacterized protein n=1 Tax=Smallanthus sonchifolius TaxID=185202 RepID=A0ACB9JKJ9_9ASTR|nr:hypothetical protein L1987_08417 [Smallanthus sonchifolius]